MHIASPARPASLGHLEGMSRMSISRRLLAAVLLANFSLPAFADDPQPGIGLATQFAGEVTATTMQGPTAGGSSLAVPGYDSHAFCIFFGVLMPNNTVDVVYGGMAWGTAAVVPPRVAQQTIFECRISNQAGQVSEFIWTDSSPMTHFGSYVLGWQISPIMICARSRTFYGTVDPIVTDTGYQCV
jgi:hypothetical protein